MGCKTGTTTLNHRSRDDELGPLYRWQLSLDASHFKDLKLAASNMLEAPRRAFEAAIVLKYCVGNVRQGEMVFG